MQQHLKTMKEVTDELQQINAEIAEEDQVMTLLNSLPRSYNSVVTTLVSQPGELNMQTVERALLHEERKMISPEETADQDRKDDSTSDRSSETPGMCLIQ